MAARKKTTRKKAARKKARKKPISEPYKKKGPGRGRPSFAPTSEHRQNVETMIGLGLTHKEIASLIHNPETRAGISTNTLERHFRQELSQGAAKMTAKIANSLALKAASADHPQSVTAGIFYLKCQAHWRQEEKIIHEVEGKTGVLVVPALTSVEDFIAEVQKDNAKTRSPKDD